MADIKINRGDVAEGILGATLTAKFVNVPLSKDKNSKLTPNQVDDILDKYFKSQGTVTYKTKDLGKNVTDNISFTMNLTQSTNELLKNRQARSIVSDLYASAIDYVESTWSKEVLKFVSNGKVDSIEINSDGLGDQKGTKADIKIIVNGQPYQRQISLKVKGGEQFAQITGTDFSKQKALWQDILSLDIESLDKAYNKALTGYDKTKAFSSREDRQVEEFKNIIKAATAVTYKAAAKQMQTLNARKDTKFYANIAKFILAGAAGKTPDTKIELVKLEKSTYKQLKFDDNFVKDYAARLKKANLQISMRPTGDPVVQVHAGSPSGPNLIFQIRIKIAAESSQTKQGKIYRPYARHIIEAGPKMFNL